MRRLPQASKTPERDTTMHLQPLEAGLIQNAKHHFKGLLVRRLLAKIDRKDDDKRITLLVGPRHADNHSKLVCQVQLLQESFKGAP